jgi:hypothetical protein
MLRLTASHASAAACCVGAAAWAVFLLASRLTKRALMDNAELWNKLARHHVVPHARARSSWLR